MIDRVSTGRRVCVRAALAVSLIASTAYAATGEHEAALAQARTGHAAEALPRLRVLLAQRPDDAALRADVVVVANWAGDDALAVELIQERSNVGADAFETAARSARNLRRYDDAVRWFDAALRLDATRVGAQAGAAASLADAGDYAAANARADAALAQTAQRVDVVLAAAYVRRRSGRAIEALALYQRAQTLQPASREAVDGARDALADLGAPRAALALPGGDAAQADRLRTDATAQSIRWAPYEPADRRDRLADARAALAEADANLARLPADAATQRRRARLDRLVALRTLERMREVVDEAAALRRDDPQLPPYATIALADALVYLREPKRAIPLYEAALAAQPRTTEVELSLMYAQLEAEDFAAAQRTVDAAAAHNATWLRAPGLVQPQTNPDRARAEITQALLLSFGDDLAGAQAKLEALVAEAPARAELHRELGVVYLRRGWPTRALEAFRIAASLDRDDVARRLAELGAQRSLGRYADVETSLQALESEVPTNLHVRRFREEWDAERGWQLDLSDRRGQGDSTVFGNRDRDTEASLASPLIGGAWRVFAQARAQHADLPEGEAAYRRAGIGLRYTRNGWDARVAWLSPRDRYADRDAVETSLRWNFSDTGWIGAQTSTASADAPLRARYYGTTARETTLAGGWRRNETSDLVVRLTRLDFSDGNRRDGVSAALRERLYTTPHFKLDGTAEAGASRNSADGVPYFNPSRDAIALGGLQADWMNWRYYDHAFRQRFGVWFGSYWQEGYGGSGVLRASYEHEWQLGPGFGLRYGIAWNRQAYDGRRESRRELYAALHWGGLPW